MPQEPWARLPLSPLQDRRLSSNGLRVYAALKTFAGCQAIYPALPTIAERAGLCCRSVQKGIRELETLGYVDVVRPAGRPAGGRTHSNRYTLHDAPKPSTGGVVPRPKPGTDRLQPTPFVSENYAVPAREVDKEEISNFSMRKELTLEQHFMEQDALDPHPTEQDDPVSDLTEADGLFSVKELLERQQARRGSPRGAKYEENHEHH